MFNCNLESVKPVYKDHPWDPKVVVVVDRWSFPGDNLCNKFRRDPKMEGLYSEVLYR